MLSVVTFKWHTPGYRAQFTAAHVHALRDMVARHYPKPHRFICFTDDATGLDAGIEALPLWDDHAQVPNPTGGGRPTCYRRLKLWAPEMRELIGERFVLLDLDTVILADLRPLWERPEDVVLWHIVGSPWPYNGAMVLANTGARPQVWRQFDPVKSPQATHAAGYRGSDQAWLSLCLGRREATWTQADGVYYIDQIKMPRLTLPANARIVFTHGGNPPWKLSYPWVTEHYPPLAGASA